jgi:hypothetical protein
MSVYTEFLEHVRASEPRREPGCAHENQTSENQTSSDYLVTGLLMRAAICLAFIVTGAVFSLV